jgi:RND family efflux transporter MFP subunit
MQASTRFILTAFLFTTACGDGPDAEDAPLQAVRVQQVRAGPVVEGRSHLSEVIPKHMVRVIAQVPGTVQELGAAEGTTMAQGSLITRISAPDIAARGRRVGAERRRAERERDFACAQLKTDRLLVTEGDLPVVQLDRSEKACASAELAVESGRAAEQEASVAGTRSLEAAPFDGRVLSYLVDPGQTVMPGTPLAVFGSQETRLRLRVVASDLANITVGTRIWTGTGGGTIEEVGVQAQGPARLYEVIASVDEPSQLQVGETLTIKVVVAEEPHTSAVPDAALGRDEAGTFVLVEEDARLRRVAVTTGPREDGWVAIAPDLPEGTRVVSGALAGLDLERSVLAVMP